VTAMVVTHDRWFLDRIATSILWFRGDQEVLRFAGNYSDVAPQREALERERAEAERARSVQAAPAASAPGKKKPGLSYKEQKELDQIESVIAACDARIRELEQLLADPALYQSRRDEVPALRAELDAKRAESEQLMNRWAELEEKRG
jgi:ABC transport system ATP-binding/permease protein